MNYCKTIFTVCVLCALPNSIQAGVIDFDDIVIWAGTGANEAALVVDWDDGRSPLAWGYRWDGTASGEDLLLAVAAADTNFYVSLNNNFAPALFGSGFGYDRDGDGFSVTGGSSATPFDASGIYLGAPSSNATAFDADDSYAETTDAPGATGFGDFWEYFTGTGNPYSGGSWVSSGLGMSDRMLTNGDWDGWRHPGFIGSVPAMANAAGAAAIPEPGSTALLAAMMCGMVARRRRRRSVTTDRQQTA